MEHMNVRPKRNYAKPSSPKKQNEAHVWKRKFGAFILLASSLGITLTLGVFLGVEAQNLTPQTIRTVGVCIFGLGLMIFVSLMVHGDTY